MAKRDSRRWRDWRVNQMSGESIRADDMRARRRLMETKEPQQEQEQATQEQATKKSPGQGWWWIPVGREGKCDGCEKELQPPQKVAYGYGRRKVYCPDCAQKEGIATECQPSRKLQRMEKALKAETAKAEKPEVAETEKAEVAETAKAEVAEKEMAAAA